MRTPHGYLLPFSRRTNKTNVIDWVSSRGAIRTPTDVFVCAPIRRGGFQTRAYGNRCSKCPSATNVRKERVSNPRLRQPMFEMPIGNQCAEGAGFKPTPTKPMFEMPIGNQCAEGAGFKPTPTKPVHG